MKSSDISVKRQAVDIDPLAMLLSAPKLDSPSNVLNDTEESIPSVSSNVEATTVVRPTVLDTTYFTDKFASECRY